MAGGAVGGVALLGVDVDARETFALEDVADHPTILVERRTGQVDRGRALGNPSRAPRTSYLGRAPGGPIAFDNSVASIPASPASLRP